MDGSNYVREQIEKAGSANFACVEAEENVVRRIFKQPEVGAEVALELKPIDFTNPDLAMIYKGIQSAIARKQQIDFVTVNAAMQRMFPQQVDRLGVKMIDLVQPKPYTVADSQSIADHVKIIKDLAARRRAIARFDELMTQLRDPSKDVSETLGDMQDAADKVMTSDAAWASMSDVLAKTFDYMEKRQKGEIKVITTGIKSVDRIIGGFFGGELTVIGARPSVGKSAFGANIALAAAREGHKVGIVSCEMVDVGFGQRLLSHSAWVDGMSLRKGDIDDEAWSKLAAAIEELGELPIEFMFDTIYVEDVVKSVLRKARRGEMDMLIVDYLQLMETRKRFDADHLRVGYISRMLKKLATKANIPVIALAQVNRETDGSMPTLKHLKDSGSIEQDCDGVIFLHRPSNENDPCIDPRDRSYFQNYAEHDMVYLCIGIAKQRQGAIGRACVVFEPAYMHYVEIEHSDCE